VPSQSADAFPATMLFKKRPRRKDILKSFTLSGGLQTLTDALSRQESIETVSEVEASRVERSGATFAVHTSDGRRFAAPTLALAVPPPQAAKLVRESFPDLAAQLERIQTATVESVGVVAAAEKLALPPVAAIIASDDLFYSAVSRDTVPDDHYRGFAFHFRPGSSAEARLERITSVLGVQRSDLELVVERQVVLPSPTLGHDDIVREIDRLTAGTRLCVTGNFFAGLAIEDCVSRSLEEVLRLRDAA
jgi:oxygen-dependent protoporphyrinogen oxidase